MKNPVLLIFRKDVRRLWPQYSVAVAMIALAAVNNVIHPVRGALHDMTQLVTPLACWLLVISAVHEERLVGDKQYWLTRPFSWRTLLAEKALFLLAFINLPMLVFQCVGMALAGFSPLDWISALFWRQVFVTIFFILPAVAVAAVTRNLGQVVIASVASYFGMSVGLRMLISASRYPSWGNLRWILQCQAALVILAGVAAVVVLQYARRRATLAAPILGCVFLLCLATFRTPVWGGAFRIQEMFSREPALAAQVRLSVDESRIGAHPMRYVSHSGDPEGVRLEIPLKAAVPPGLRLVGQWSSARIDSPRGAWRSGTLVFSAFHASPKDGAWFTVYVPREFYDANRDIPVRLSGALDFALFRQIAKLKATEAAQISRTGFCKFLSDGQCYAPTLRLAVSEVPLDGEPEFESATLAPFPMEVAFQTVDRAIRWGEWLLPQSEGWNIHLGLPVACTQRVFEVHDVPLSKFHLDGSD